MTHLTTEALLALREPLVEPGYAADREHLRGCPACQAEFERLHQRIARLKALPALRPPRDRWPVINARLRAERARRRLRIGVLGGLAAAASIAAAVVIQRPNTSVEQAAAHEIQQEMERSRALEHALDHYDPDQRMLDGRTAGIAQALEDRIAEVDRALEMAELLERQRREERLLELWRERVGLLDALVDVHVTHASDVGL